MYVYDITHVCMYVSMYLCIYVSMYLCIYVSMYLCMYVCIYVCMYVCMFVHTYVCMYVCTEITGPNLSCLSSARARPTSAPWLMARSFYQSSAIHMVYWVYWFSNFAPFPLNCGVFLIFLWGKSSKFSDILLKHANLKSTSHSPSWSCWFWAQQTLPANTAESSQAEISSFKAGFQPF